VTTKLSLEALGIDLGSQAWQRSGERDGSIEIAFARAPGTGGESRNARTWVLMRVAGDPEERVLIFDRNEWDCFLDGVRNGEFDDVADASR
jgi:Domain of unknown function (DUF397)